MSIVRDTHMNYAASSNKLINRNSNSCSSLEVVAITEVTVTPVVVLVSTAVLIVVLIVSVVLGKLRRSW